MAHPRLKTDSSLSRRIVRAFLNFLDSVEPAHGVDAEGLEVAKECLTEAFRLDSSLADDQIKTDLLVEMFSSLEENRKLEVKSNVSSGANLADAPSSSGVPETSKNNSPEAPTFPGDDWMTQADSLGVEKDELFGKFFAALEKINFFETTTDGRDDPDQLEKATCRFHEALAEMERSGSQELNQNGLAEALKIQGNRAMQSKLYTDAIELYSCAIALRGDSAVYYCNRAAAYTQIQKYSEAIRDCLKSIEIDPNYSKAYSRLGLVYYAQGNYVDAIEKGFKKALQLDPNNESVRENIRVAEQKIREQQRTEHGQGTNSGNNRSSGGSRSHSVPPFFTSMPFPADFANNMFRNMAANGHHGQHSENRQAAGAGTNGSEEPGVRTEGNMNWNIGEHVPEEVVRSAMGILSGSIPLGNPLGTTNGGSAQHSETTQAADGNADGFEEPGIRIEGNMNFNFGDQLPEEVMRSVMEIFSGGIPHGNQQDTTNGRSASN